MSLPTGARLGPYEILAALGAGGMGEVYKARDTRLDRTVAIKVLPAHVAADPDLRARFEREARAVAALQHPHICTLYDVGEAPNPEPSNPANPTNPANPANPESPIPNPILVQYLVMEYLDGETLAARLERGPLSLDQALQYAIQIADALDKAHRHGITHRDLKPGNVMLTKSGAGRQGSPQVKLLDFGLARTGAGGAGRAGGMTALPTEAPLTGAGTILGTLQYMAPEQLEGGDADARTDIFAFGVVVYEMVTGKKAFEGKSQASLIAAILERDPPPISTLQPLTPPLLDHLVRRCLAKDPDDRWQTARDLEEQLKWIADARSQAGGSTPVVAHRKGLSSNARVAWSVAATLLVGCVAALALGGVTYVRRAPADTRSVRFQISLPDTWLLRQGAGGGEPGAAAPLAVSPDGQRIAFAASNAAGASLLWVRPLDALTAQPLTGTDDASSPFWSPDGRYLGFFAGGKLKSIDVSGGPPMTLCDVLSSRGGTWSPAGVIVFGQTTGVLHKVSASGGVPTAASTLGQGEVGHWRPSFLPDGRHFLYRGVRATGSAAGPIFLASLDSTERTLLLNADSVNVVYTQNHVLFLRETTLMAQPFDERRLALKGDAFPIAEQIQTQGGPTVLGVFTASENGVLAYQTRRATPGSQLVWFDRSGKQIGVLGDKATYDYVQLSPDGGRAAVSLTAPGQNNPDIWLYDVARGLRTRFTFDPAIESDPIWSPDGSRIVFSSTRAGHRDLRQKASTGAGTEEQLPADSLNRTPTSWSPDGRFILYTVDAGATSNDLWVLPLSGNRKPFPFLQTPFGESSGQFSPDGRWVAYQSNESGLTEVYVAPFPEVRGKWMISTAGGSRPRWSRDGKEIFYLDRDRKLVAAAVVTSGKAGFEVGAVKPLFETRRTGAGYPYDVLANGQRFLVNTGEEQAGAAPITVVVNWAAGVRK